MDQQTETEMARPTKPHCADCWCKIDPEEAALAKREQSQSVEYFELTNEFRCLECREVATEDASWSVNENSSHYVRNGSMI
jgi:hypothetical protein